MFKLFQGLYGITGKDIAACKKIDVLSQVWELCLGGAVAVQLRDKTSSADEYRSLARKAKMICERFSIPLIINDRIEVAKELNLPLHLGQEDLQKVDLKLLIKDITIFGISTHNLEQALDAERLGAAYIGIGPVFSTPTKPEYLPIGLSVLQEVIDKVNVPAVAIGGITMNVLLALKEMGVRNVAMVREILTSNDIAAAVARANSIFYS